MKLGTKLLSLILCICMLVPLFAACSSNDDPLDEYVEPEVIFEPYDYSEDDKFALTASAVMTMVTDKIMSTAKDKAKAYASNLGNKVMTKATDWLKEKLLYCLEIEPTPDPPQYTATDVYNKLTTIEGDIKDMKNTLEILQNQTTDNQYYTKYTAFVNNFSDIRIYTETPFNSLETLNGMSEDSISDYSALAGSIEVSLRGSGNYAVPIEQQTELSKKTLAYGNAILGDETSSSLLNTYGIFNIIRYFAERETPWAHQRKEIEDTYLSSIIYSYRNAHALTVFDFAYQMNVLGVEEVYLAPDGNIIAFKYSETPFLSPQKETHPTDSTKTCRYWYIGNTKTGVYTESTALTNVEAMALTCIGDNGNWWICNQDTGIKAETDAKWYYNAYPYDENRLKTNYDATFANLSETPVSITDVNSEVYSQLTCLFGYYGQHQAQYNKILRALASFTREDNDTYFVLETQSNRQYAIDLFGCSPYPNGTSPSNKYPSSSDSFISWDSSGKEFTIDFDKFKNCTQSEFLAFIEIIKPYAGDKSLYDYLRFVGFKVTRVNGVNALALGIETKADDEYDNRLQSNWTYPRNFIIYWINIDTKVKDISSNSFSKTWYSANRYYGGACNNKPEWRDYWNMSRSTLKYEGGESYSEPNYFLSLHGLSTSSLSGKVGRWQIGTKW